ncbi:hypothetical protein HYU11_00280 [Candidatus Woesearchaeota archaeon]|nr:hypothetical protein [Candidatus Woesearchaeota archaeon]
MGKKRIKLSSRAIIEIAGKPKDYVEKTMALVVKKLREEDGINIRHCKMHNAKENSGIFNTFSEIEAEFNDYESILNFCFNYMPSSIEFIDPEQIIMEQNDLTSFFNDLLLMLHETDSKLKNSNASNMILERNANNLLKIALTFTLREGEKSIDLISMSVGIVPDQLRPFLDKYVQENILTKSGDNYALKNATA